MTKKTALVLISSLLLALIPLAAHGNNGPRALTFNCLVSRDTLRMDGLKDEQGNIYISLNNENTKNLCLCLGGILTCSGDTISLNKETRTTVINSAAPGEMEKDIIVTKKAVAIKASALMALLNARMSYDRSKDIYIIRPVISSITAEEQSDGLIVRFQASSNMKYTSRQLHKPERLVLEIEDVAIDDSSKVPDHPLLKGTVTEQKEGRTRIILPVPQDYRAELQSRILPNTASVKISKGVRGTEDNKGEENPALESISVEDTREYVKIRITTSAPFSYQWTRLQPPDNRFFIDFLDTDLKAETTTFEPQNVLVQKIRAAQTQPGPDGVTRLVLDLTQPAFCEVSTSQNPRMLTITIRNQIIDVDRALMCGSGTTEVSSFTACGQTVCIDPGHGGSDHGACNHGMGMAEKHVTLAISMKLADILRQRGWKVQMTRTTDRDVTYAGSPDKEELQARANGANGAQVFISVHINASVSKQANGVSTHWYKDCDRSLAQEINCQLIEKTGRRDRGISRDRFFVLRNTDIPSVLVEAGFISNDEEAGLLGNEEYLQRIAQGIADGLGTYMAKTMQKRIAAKSSGSSKK